jgi:hypothetical protein
MSTNYEPVSSGFIGVYRSVYLNDSMNQPVACSSFSDNSNLNISKVNTFDGRAISMIASNGNFSQSLKLDNSPILVGDHSDFMDAREFMLYSINNLFPLLDGVEREYDLPLLKTASLSISETEANINFDLMSDGIRAYQYGSNHEIFLKSQPDNLFDYCASPTRVAYNKDFVYAFGPYQALVISGNYTINHDIRDFAVNRQTVIDTLGAAPLNNADTNRQYKILVPGKMSISANGVALVDLESCSINTNYDKSGYQYLSKQDPGYLNLFKQNIVGAINGNQFELFMQKDNTYIPFFRDLGRVGIQIISSYINSLSFSANENEITVSFDCELNAQLAIY